MVRAWTEGTGGGVATGDGATWDTYNGVNAWQTAGAGGVNDRETASIGTRAFTTTETLNQFKNWTLDASKVQEWVDGVFTNNGILIKSDVESNDGYWFASSDHATAANRPKLTIEYTLPASSNKIIYASKLPKLRIN